MFKKLLPFILALCIAGCINTAVFSDNTTEENLPNAQQEMPDRLNGGRRGEMPSPPQDPPENFSPNGEMPKRDGNNGFGEREGKKPPQNFEAQNGLNEQQGGEAPQNAQANTADEKNAQQNPQPFDNEKSAENTENERPEINNDGNMPPNMQMPPSEDWLNDAPQENESASFGFFAFVKNYSTPLFALLVLAIAFVFVIFYKRKRY